MIKNYINLAFRRLIKDKFFSVLNITGLTVGVTSFILLTLYVNHELSYDKFHSKGDRIFALAKKGRVLNESGTATEKYRVSFAAVMKERIPELEQMAMLSGVNFENLLKIGTNSFYEDHVLWSNNEIFEIFDFSIIEGAARLHEPGTAVLGENLAKKYFGDKSPVGEFLEVVGEGVFEITAVAANPPKNSHIQYELLLSNFKELEKAAAGIEGGGGSVSTNYILMPEGVDIKALEDKLGAFINSDLPESARSKDAEDKYVNNTFFFPYEDIHLKSGFNWALTPVYDIRYVYLFASIAVLILIIACLNYVNLVTARSIKRIKEIGLRKVMGAERREIVKQTMVESFLFTLISVVIAFALAERLLPFFNNLIGRELTLSYFSSELLVFVFGLSLIVGFSAGLYPAIRLTKFNPIQALSGSNKQREKTGVRRVLVFFQFFIAQGLIVATIIIQSQLSFLQNKELGYDREQLLYIKAFDELGDRAITFRNKMQAIPGIEAVSLSESIIQYNGITLKKLKNIEGFEDSDSNEYLITEVFEVDDQFTSTMGMKIIEGTSFADLEDIAPANAIIINEACKKKLGWDNPIGKKLDMWGGDRYVVGVIQDFHNESLKVEVKPAILVYTKDPSLFVTMRISPVDIQKTISSIEGEWDEMVADRPFEFQFYDDYYDAQYREETRLGQVFNGFSSLAICISILGLIGLTAFSAEQRLKEFGIRKVLGAKVNQIALLLSKEFVFLIIIAFMAASPIAYFGLQTWLAEYIYRIDLSAYTFILALLITMVISAIPVVYQSFKVSKVNPANILRNE